MPHEISLGIGLLMAITLWLAIKHAIAVHRAAQQLQIAQAGATCLGKVVAIQRPFMLDDCTRLYFDFVPSGTDTPVRACHIAWRNAEETLPSLPPQGATVTVRYLPDRPCLAVIGKLVAG